MDPEKFFRETGKKLGTVGKTVINIPGKGLQTVHGGVSTAFHAVCMYICMYMLYLCMRVYVVFMYVYTFISICVYIHVYVFIHVYRYIHVHPFARTFTYVFKYV
jgi:hypothetical protein